MEVFEKKEMEQYNDLVEKLISLVKKEREFSVMNLEMTKILDLKDEAYFDHKDLIIQKKNKENQCVVRNRKSIYMNMLLLVIFTILFCLLTGYVSLELFNILPKIFKIIYFLVSGSVVGYEIYRGVKDLNCKEKLYDGLDSDQEYIELIEKIKEKEHEIKNLDAKYNSLRIKNMALDESIRELYDLINNHASEIGKTFDKFLVNGVYDEVNYEREKNWILTRVRKK